MKLLDIRQRPNIELIDEDSNAPRASAGFFDHCIDEMQQMIRAGKEDGRDLMPGRAIPSSTTSVGEISSTTVLRTRSRWDSYCDSVKTKDFA